jgi:hypothetical protein
MMFIEGQMAAPDLPVRAENAVIAADLVSRGDHPVLVLRESLVHYDRHRPRQSRQRRLPDIENAVRPGVPAHGPSAENPSSRE